MTIPKAIRDSLRLPLGGRVMIDFDGSTRGIRFIRLPSMRELAGSFRVKNPRNAVKLRAYMEKHYRRI